MRITTEIRYASLLGSSYLDQFKVRRSSPYLANFRCPICGDSEFNKTKTRGYIIERKGSLSFYCHNCSASMPLWKLLKERYYALYEQLRMEEFEDWGKYKRITTENHEREFIPKRVVTHATKRDDSAWFDGLTSVLDLPVEHPAIKYIVKRRIPDAQRHLLYFVDNFGAWGSHHFPAKITTTSTEPRLILPILASDGMPIGCSARVLDKSEPRYYTLFETDDHFKIFGLDRLDVALPYFITEGAIDSLFIDNAIAMLGTSLNLHELPIPMGVENAVFAYDNESRNKDVINNMIHKVKDGYKIVVFPSAIKEKDINEMVLSGTLSDNPEEVSVWLLDHSYSGLSALAQISQWRKVYNERPKSK